MSTAARVALVTGGSRGLGAAIARRLAADGHAIALTYRKEFEKAQRVCEEICDAGGTAMAFQAEGAETASVEHCVAAARERLGSVDVLINNLGVIGDRLALAMGADFERVVRTNLRSTFLFTRAVLPAMMRARFGRVVAISSMVARNPAAPGQCNYVASKAAIHGFVRSVAKEVAARGITVNAIAAGFVATDLSRAVLRARPGVVLAIPMKRVAEPVEIASLVAYLATDGAQYVTGEVIGATGGMCQ